jgi:thioredoxin 1
MAMDLTKSNFDKTLSDSDVPVLIDFWAPWCGPCRILTPMLEKLSTDLKGKAKVYKVNVDKEPELAGRFGIRGIPTVITFKNGQQDQQLVGVRQEQEYKKALGV